MAANQILDIFASKGTEYLLTIGFLLVLLIFWRFLFARDRDFRSAYPLKTNGPDYNYKYQSKTQTDIQGKLLKSVDGFLWNPKLYYHPGHTWLAKCDENLLVTGLDDFAQRLVGKIKLGSLPQPGDQLTIGKPAFSVELEGKSIPVLSAVSGNIAEVNSRIAANPELINKEPYQSGWIFKVRNDDVPSALKNLMYGPAARFWMQYSAERLFNRILPGTDLAMADGGLLTENLISINRELDAVQLVSEFLLSENLEKAG